MNNLYILTPMTGKEASESRTIVIGTVELNYRVWIIIMMATVPSLFVTMIVWVFLGSYAILTPPVVMAAAVFMFHRRTADGMKLRTYQSMWDKKKSALNQFFICGEPIEMNNSDYQILTPNTVMRTDLPESRPTAAPQDSQSTTAARTRAVHGISSGSRRNHYLIASRRGTHGPGGG